MRLLLLSDIHANLEALEACLEAAPPHDQVVNLGDVVGYNASPNEVCERVRAMGGTIVRGNHDRVCSGLTDMADFNLVAAMSAKLDADHAPARTSRVAARAAARARCTAKNCLGVEFVHGSPRDEDEYVLNRVHRDG